MSQCVLSIQEIAEKLVAFNTVSQGMASSTRGMADFVSAYAEDAGFQVRQFPYVAGKVERVNIIATKGGSEPFLALSGHMDTVAASPKEWAGPGKDPFRLVYHKTSKAERYYGRGIADMKLFLAIALMVGARIETSALRKPLALYFTSDEEVGCVGIKRLLKTEGVPVPRFAIIGEPTNGVPICLHKGYVYLEIELRGKSGHASNPDSGCGVVREALPCVIRTINEIERKLRGSRDERFEVPFPTLNIGVVHTGTGAAKNIIPDRCFLEVEVRPLPGQDEETLVDLFDILLKRAIGQSRDDGPIRGVEVLTHLKRTPTPAMETPRNSPVVTVAERITDKRAGSVPFNTEGGVFGKAGVESIVWGPGSIAQAHKPDEYVDAQWLQPSIVAAYESAVRKLCCERE